MTQNRDKAILLKEFDGYHHHANEVKAESTVLFMEHYFFFKELTS